MDKLEEIELIISEEEYGFERLVQLSNDSNCEVRLRAIEALYPFSDTPQVIVRARESIKDPDELVRITGLELLGDWREMSSLPDIISCLKDDEWLVRANAAITLGKLGDKAAIDAIEAKLDDVSNDEELLRYYIALWCLGEKPYRKKALDFLKNPNYRIRCAVANLLVDCEGYLDRKNFVKELDNALKKEKTEAVRSSIRNALENFHQRT